MEWRITGRAPSGSSRTVSANTFQASIKSHFTFPCGVIALHYENKGNYYKPGVSRPTDISIK